MMRAYRIGLLFLAWACASGAQAASFDCSKARSVQERMICGDARLSEMDDRLAAAYTSALQASYSPEQVRTEQRQWVALRNRCSDPACLEEAYERRTAALTGTQSAYQGTFAPLGPSCRQSIGAARAAVLVRQCMQVSPATHPPCNDANACDMITDEIQRGCGMLTSTIPAFCRQYSPAR